MNVGELGHVEIDDPQGWPIIIVFLVTVVLADTSTVDDRKISWPAVNRGVRPEVLFHFDFDIEEAEIVVSAVMADETPVISQEVIDK